MTSPTIKTLLESYLQCICRLEANLMVIGIEIYLFEILSSLAP
jgi:hypothetical protein